MPPHAFSVRQMSRNACALCAGLPPKLVAIVLTTCPRTPRPLKLARGRIMCPLMHRSGPAASRAGCGPGQRRVFFFAAWIVVRVGAGGQASVRHGRSDRQREGTRLGSSAVPLCAALRVVGGCLARWPLWCGPQKPEHRRQCPPPNARPTKPVPCSPVQSGSFFPLNVLNAYARFSFTAQQSYTGEEREV
jgi:hypothetical protein